jgi:hypothetical protein
MSTLLTVVSQLALTQARSIFVDRIESNTTTTHLLTTIRRRQLNRQLQQVYYNTSEGWRLLHLVLSCENCTFTESSNTTSLAGVLLNVNSSTTKMLENPLGNL